MRKIRAKLHAETDRQHWQGGRTSRTDSTGKEEGQDGTGIEPLKQEGPRGRRCRGNWSKNWTLHLLLTGIAGSQRLNDPRQTISGHRNWLGRRPQLQGRHFLTHLQVGGSGLSRARHRSHLTSQGLDDPRQKVSGIKIGGDNSPRCCDLTTVVALPGKKGGLICRWEDLDSAVASNSLAPHAAGPQRLDHPRQKLCGTRIGWDNLPSRGDLATTAAFAQ